MNDPLHNKAVRFVASGFLHVKSDCVRPWETKAIFNFNINILFTSMQQHIMFFFLSQPKVAGKWRVCQCIVRVVARKKGNSPEQASVHFNYMLHSEQIDVVGKCSRVGWRRKA